MKRLALLLAVQVALVAVWLLVERGREPEPPFAAERLDEPAPPLAVELRGLAVTAVEFGDQPLLVHFWATWCVPCREELPSLLQAARATDLRLLALTDEDWPVIETFFAGQVPEEVARDPGGEARTRFRVSGLPDTFVLRDDGRVIARVGGARDWSRRGAREFLSQF